MSTSGSESISDSLSTSTSGSESLSDSLSTSLSESLSTSTSGSTSISDSLSPSTSESILPNGIVGSDNIDEDNLSRSNSSDNQHNLPETGEHKNEGLFGAVLAFLVGLGLIRKSKKSRKDKDK